MDVLYKSNLRVRLTIVGCGGSGSQLLPHVMQLASNNQHKIEKIILIDGDDFEKKNIANQKCLDEEAGMNKADALAERFSYVYPELNGMITSYPHYIKDMNTLLKLSYGGEYLVNILISCVDNNATRKLFNDAFELCNKEKKNMIYIDSGNGDINRVGQVIVGYTYGGDIKLRPVAAYFPDILEDKDDINKLNSCTRISSEYSQNIATNIFAATILFCVVTNIISFGKIDKGIVYFDANNVTAVSR